MKRNNSLTYKGFYGSINFDQEEKIFFGQIEFIKDLVNYEARDAESLVNLFQEAVDDYLVSCKKDNKQPDKAFKGSFQNWFNGIGTAMFIAAVGNVLMGSL